MKLAQLFENESILATMLLKLVKAKKPIYVNAKGRTFLSGNTQRGYQAMRSTKEGWVVQAEYMLVDPVDILRRAINNDQLHISPYKEFALYGRGATSTMLFEFERPIDDNYTIKKINGVWTIIDREQVTNEEKIKKSYLNFKGSSRKKELKAEMTREIKRFKDMEHTDPAAYPDDWTADQKYKAELKKKGKNLPKSEHTKKFERRFGK